jgi:hypothetical protein
LADAVGVQVAQDLGEGPERCEPLEDVADDRGFSLIDDQLLVFGLVSIRKRP